MSGRNVGSKAQGHGPSRSRGERHGRRTAGRGGRGRQTADLIAEMNNVVLAISGRAELVTREHAPEKLPKLLECVHRYTELSEELRETLAGSPAGRPAARRT